MTVDRVSFDGWPIHPDYQHVQWPEAKEEDKTEKIVEDKNDCEPRENP